MNLVSVQRDEYGEDIPGTKIQLLYADTLKELCAAIGKFFSCSFIRLLYCKIFFLVRLIFL
jgi:hypothetical protein